MKAVGAMSIDQVVTGLYEAISFSPGGQPDWERLASLFWSEGRLIPMPREGGFAARMPLTVAQFIDTVAAGINTGQLALKGFRESEIGRRTDQFGNIAHVFSAYRATFADGDPTEIGSGINSIQLLCEDGRWSVISMTWDDERSDNPIPPEYRRSV